MGSQTARKVDVKQLLSLRPTVGLGMAKSEESELVFQEVLEPSLCDNIVTSYDGQVDDDGRYHGIGTAVLDNGVVYDGEFKMGLMHGSGKIVWPDGTTYEGSMASGTVRAFP